MAIAIEAAPSTGFQTLQTALRAKMSALEALLEQERTQLPLWLPVFFGLGIALWFVIPTQNGWIALCGFGLAVAGVGCAVGLGKRIGLALALAGVMTSAGCGTIWLRAMSLGAPVLARPIMALFEGALVSVEPKAALDQVRLFVAPDPQFGLPGRIRVSLKADDAVPGLVPGARIRLKARLMPPADAAVPGGFDFARNAWFQRLGATGKVLGTVEVLGGTAATPAASRRQQLSAYIAERVGPTGAGIAAALVSGDQGRVTDIDQQAMRASGLAHLLSVSGLHLSAVVGAVMFLTLRLLALSPALALRFSLPLIAAGTGALAGIGYTLLTGSEVPTVRSCIAALLVLAGLAMGREAMTLRLVATGAFVVLMLWPESLIGPSFQLSFAAITAIVALHEVSAVQNFLRPREEPVLRRMMRLFISLLLTGLAVEIALAPIALFHFHKSGIYGALANIIAIPLTTFVIMPLEALALLFDAVGAGAPFWWLAGKSIESLLWTAHVVAGAPGSVAMVPQVPTGAYALILAGGIWALLWRARPRLLGFVPLMIGALWAMFLSPPDLLITEDGRHVAIRGDDGRMSILRPRAGDYVRSTLADRGGTAELDDIDAMQEADCSADSCIVETTRAGRVWRVLATRTKEKLPWVDFTAACAAADIVISDRMLPRGCSPRWFRADRHTLAQTGGLAITFESGAVVKVRQPGDEHPWHAETSSRPLQPNIDAKARQARLGLALDSARSVALHTHD